MIGRKRHKDRGALAWLVPTVDGFMVIAIVFLAVVAIKGLILTSFVPTIKIADDYSQSLRTRVEGMSRLPVAADLKSESTLLLAAKIPEDVGADDNISLQLYKTAGKVVANKLASDAIEAADDSLWQRFLSDIANSSTKVSQAMADDLCSQLDAVLPEAPDNLDRVSWANYNARVHEYGERVWAAYQKCQEPVIKIIDEDLLQFRLEKHDEFEHDPARAFRKIKSYVDEHVKTHRRIYIVGHTDRTASNRYNDMLSFRRALFIADLVRDHLKQQKLKEGRDFDVFAVGMGEYQPVERKRGETNAEFWKRCRRIELSFRAQGAAG